MFKAIVSTVALVIALGAASLHAAPDKIELEGALRQKTAEFFEHLANRTASFEKHYNVDLNGCFLLVRITKSKTGKRVTWVEWQLWDLDENSKLDMLGYKPSRRVFVPGTSENACWVGDFTNCRVGERFGATVRRYMQR